MFRLDEFTEKILQMLVRDSSLCLGKISGYTKITWGLNEVGEAIKDTCVTKIYGHSPDAMPMSEQGLVHAMP